MGGRYKGEGERNNCLFEVLETKATLTTLKIIFWKLSGIVYTVFVQASPVDLWQCFSFSSEGLIESIKCRPCASTSFIPTCAFTDELASVANKQTRETNR